MSPATRGSGEAGRAPAAPEQVVRVRSTSHQRFVNELEARDHRWLSDRPRGAGGDGLGPTPLELLLGSFAAHTAMGILDLAREKEWAVDGVDVQIVQAGAPTDGEPGGITRELVIMGELDDEERRELEREVSTRWPRDAWLPPGELRDSFTYA